MKELSKQLLDKARLNLGDDEYRRIESYVKLEAWTSLRVYLGDLAEVYDIKHMLDDNRVDEWKAIDEMNNIAIEIAIQKNDGADDRIIHSRRKRISRRPTTIL